MSDPADPGQARSADSEWSDERLDAAFQARFSAGPPAGLEERVQRDLAASEGSRRRQRRWPPVTLGFRRASALGGLAAVAVVAVVASAVWVSSPGNGTSGSLEATSIAGPSGVAGQPWPAEITVPGAERPQPVLSVSDAIAIRDDETSAREIAVGGWFEFNAVPCPQLPDDAPSLEDCVVAFTWLMAAPEQLHDPASDGSGTIHPPVGPGINLVLARVDWSSFSNGTPVPAVFVGHFHDTEAAACPQGDVRTTCEQRFVVDSVAWSSGVANDLAAAPRTVFGLPVVDVTEAMSFRAAGSDEELAVRGWYQAPGPLSCPSQPVPGVPFLEEFCDSAFTWLMAKPESLMSRSAGGASMHGPLGPAIQPVFAGATRPTVTFIFPGSSIPVPAIFVGHFNDRRSALCTAAATPAESQESCRERFVVDAVAWLNGNEPGRWTTDWRDPAGPQPTPWLDPLRNVVGDGTVLGVLVVTGERVGQIEPELTRKPTDLSSATYLEVATILDLNPMPTYYKGVFLAGPMVRTVVMGECAVYVNAGDGFELVQVFRCGAPQPSGSP